MKHAQAHCVVLLLTGLMSVFEWTDIKQMINYNDCVCRAARCGLDYSSNQFVVPIMNAVQYGPSAYPVIDILCVCVCTRYSWMKPITRAESSSGPSMSRWSRLRTSRSSWNICSPGNTLSPSLSLLHTHIPAYTHRETETDSCWRLWQFLSLLIVLRALVRGC